MRVTQVFRLHSQRKPSRERYALSRATWTSSRASSGFFRIVEEPPGQPEQAGGLLLHQPVERLGRLRGFDGFVCQHGRLCRHGHLLVSIHTDP
jgi:hypothetical protein